jgi:hypothetical protein
MYDPVPTSLDDAEQMSSFWWDQQDHCSKTTQICHLDVVTNEKNLWGIRPRVFWSLLGCCESACMILAQQQCYVFRPVGNVQVDHATFVEGASDFCGHGGTKVGP